MTTTKKNTSDTTCNVCGGTGFIDKTQCHHCNGGKVKRSKLTPFDKLLIAERNENLSIEQLLKEIEKEDESYEDPPDGVIEELDV